MKKILLSVALCISMLANAQDAEKREVKYEYIQLPSRPLPANTMNYHVTVDAPYAAKNDEKKEEYEKNKVALETRNKEKADAYKQKTTMQKIADRALLDEKKPVAEHMSELKLSRTFDLDMLANMVKLEGMNDVAGNGLKINISLMGFEMLEPVVTFDNIFSGGQTNKKYKYEISYKHPVVIKAEVIGSQFIYSETPEKLNSFSKFYTEVYNSEAELKANYEKNKEAILSSLEEKAVMESIKGANLLLNDYHALKKVKHESDIWVAEGKKYNYTDYITAFETASQAYVLLKNDAEKKESKAKLVQSIALWQTAFSQADLKDKKARVNREIAGATLLNIAEAQMWSDQYDEARITLTKLNGMDMKGKEKRQSESISKMIEELEPRYKVYFTK
ncbi:MAG: hypothetical protein V4620_15175 [Bacteroidota bacterium]